MRQVVANHLGTRRGAVARPQLKVLICVLREEEEPVVVFEGALGVDTVGQKLGQLAGLLQDPKAARKKPGVEEEGAAGVPAAVPSLA